MARPKGSKNIKTVEEEQFRERFRLYCYQGGFDQFMEELKQLKGASYVKYFLSALEFEAPRLARVDHGNADNKPFKVDYTDEQVEKILKILTDGKSKS